MTAPHASPRGQLTDEALVSSALSGAPWAKAEIYRRYVTMVHRTAAKLTPWSSEIEDIVQEVFVTAFRKLKQLRDPSRLAGWLRTMAVHHARDVGRKHSLRRRLGLIPDQLFDYNECISSDAPADAVVELRQLLADLTVLPTDARIAWSLRMIEQCTVDEIADRMGISRSTVKRRIAQAERRLEKAKSKGGTYVEEAG